MPGGHGQKKRVVRGGLILRRREAELLDAAERGERIESSQVAAVIRRLGSTRRALERTDELDWQSAYEAACDGFARVLGKWYAAGRRLDRLAANYSQLRDELYKARRQARSVPALESETRRLREERDDLRERAKSEFARGMRLGREKGRQGAATRELV